MDMTAYAFSTQPGFVEDETRELFRKAVALRTIVIYCYDPRAVNIPNAVAGRYPARCIPVTFCAMRRGGRLHRQQPSFQSWSPAAVRWTP